jgi:hypothetical protein
MRAPPPVEFTSAPGRGWAAALSLLVGAAAGVPLAWAMPYLAAEAGAAVSQALGDPLVQAALALPAGALAARTFGRLRGHGALAQAPTLRWDGQDWLLVSGAGDRPEQRGDVELMLDLGPWMLVRFLPQAGMGRAAWLPLTAGADRARWAALRGALWNWRPGREGVRP